MSHSSRSAAISKQLKGIVVKVQYLLYILNCKEWAMNSPQRLLVGFRSSKSLFRRSSPFQHISFPSSMQGLSLFSKKKPGRLQAEPPAPGMDLSMKMYSSCLCIKHCSLSIPKQKWSKIKLSWALFSSWVWWTSIWLCRKCYIYDQPVFLWWR